MTTADSYRPLPSLEGHLSFQVTPVAISPRTEAPIPGDESTDWTKRWCTLEDGVLRVYVDRTSADARPEQSLRSIHLTKYQNLKSSVEYDAGGSGRCELTLCDALVDTMQTLPLQLPPKSRSIPRSSTSASLSVAFERSASSIPKKQVPSLRPRQWSESTESVNQKSHNTQLSSSSSSTWSNKFATKSKRFYQLMASNMSSQSLSEQGGKQASDGGDGTIPQLPSLASSATLLGMSSRNSTVNNFATLRQQQQQQQDQYKPLYQPQQTASSTLVLRPENAGSMMEWAEAISRCLGTSSSSRVLRSPASLSVLPSHARARRPRAASSNDDNDDDDVSPLYSLPGTTSSLVSAAMASRRKREDSAAKIIALKTELQKNANTASSSPRMPSSKEIPAAASGEQSRSLLAAIKSKRRASLEIFTSSLTGRKSSSEVERRGSTTYSTGNSTRSSICCAGEAARMSWERSIRNDNNNTNGAPAVGAPPNSLAIFSSSSGPFNVNHRMVFSSARRRSSVKSVHSVIQHQQQQSVYAAPVAPSSIVATSMTRSASTLESNGTPSTATDDFDLHHQHSADSSLSPSPLSQGPLTPLMGDTDHFGMPLAEKSEDLTTKTEWSNSGRQNRNILGLNLYYDTGKDTDNLGPHDTVLPSLPYRSFEAQNVIVESPTREDLATLIANSSNNSVQDIDDSVHQEEGKSPILRVPSPFRRPGNGQNANKLVSSPSMPMLRSYSSSNRSAFVMGTDEDEDEVRNSTTSSSSLLNQLQASSLRFATFGKVSGRRPIQPRAILAKGVGGVGITASNSSRSNLMNKISPPARVSSPLQRPSTSTGFRIPTAADIKSQSLVMPISNTTRAPVMERILPPEEMIATFDRLRNQASLPSLHQQPTSPKMRPSISRPMMLDANYLTQYQNRANINRPRTGAMTAF